MPKYEVNRDGADEALDPQDGNPKVSFNSKDTNPERKIPRTKTIVIVVLIALCIIVVLLLFVWFIYTIVDTRPEWQLDNFYIETIPGYRYHPEDHATETLIAYNYLKPQSYKKWVDVIQTQLQDYTNTTANQVVCDYDRPPEAGQVCSVDVSKWFPCIHSNNYGYSKGSPCVFIRFNKIVDWIPELYDTPANLPENMPDYLKSTITRENQLFYKLGQTVWLSCTGVDPTDRENMGPLRMIPRMGFPGYFFPYNNTENYLSPLVAIYFEKPA
ncbi:hypothetical protein L9F63_013136, partial [Diploptera punctata]